MDQNHPMFGKGQSRRAMQRRLLRESKALQAAKETEFAKTHLVENAPPPVEPIAVPEPVTEVVKVKKARAKKKVILKKMPTKKKAPTMENVIATAIGGSKTKKPVQVKRHVFTKKVQSKL